MSYTATTSQSSFPRIAETNSRPIRPYPRIPALSLFPMCLADHRSLACRDGLLSQSGLFAPLNRCLMLGGSGAADRDWHHSAAFAKTSERNGGGNDRATDLS